MINSSRLIFINGSINAGKTTVSKLVAEKLNAKFVNFDDLNDTIPNFNLAHDIPKTFDIGIKLINDLTSNGSDVVANYVIRTEDWDRVLSEIDTPKKYFFTLAPRIEVAQSNRGARELSEWEVNRIKHHYDTGVANPEHGVIIDNSEITPDETAAKILSFIQK